MSTTSPSVRARLRRGDPVVGSWIATASPIAAELMAATGFDFLAVDVEHSAADLPQTMGLFQAMRSGNPRCEAFVRLAGHSYASNKRFLDAGATGIIAPLVTTAAQARELTRAAKYPPVGGRGVGFCRDNLYGLTLEDRVAHANDDTTVVVQIESIDGVRHIDEILAVPGINAAFIGPYDLSASMGITAQFDHPRLIEAKQQVLAACQRHQVAAGIHVVQPDPDDLLRQIDAGYRFLAYSLDITMLLASSRRGLDAIRAGLARRPN